MNPQTTLTNDQIVTVFRKHNLAQDPDITRITIGFTNEVYTVDDYILKVCVKPENEPNFRKEEFLYGLLQGAAPVPHIIVADDSRAVLDKPYMIYEKLLGKPAASHWHEMNDEQRKQLIKDVCGYLKAIDQTPLEKYDEQLSVDPSFNWQQHICDRIEAKLGIIAEQKLLPETTTAVIRQFVKANRHVLKEQRLGLTFWDVHFDNILINDDFKLSGLIDFESIDVNPIDYRLMVVRLMQRYPHLYLSKGMEQYAETEDYAHLMEWYKEFYPELFEFADIDRRIDLYELLDIVSKLPDWPKAKVLKERLATVLDARTEQEAL
jgi:aminoglycoside phosphotransferase (APT) family kinase protein